MIETKPSIASTANSIKFDGERVIRAKHGQSERRSLEATALIGDGEEDISSMGTNNIFLKLAYHEHHIFLLIFSLLLEFNLNFCTSEYGLKCSLGCTTDDTRCCKSAPAMSQGCPGYPEFADAPVAVDLRSSHGSDRISDAKLIILWLVRRKQGLHPDEIQ
ncbi:hypothetical protein M405DRAFT_883065 [Rhizopogon salebrosus TDB-379]|nr:hypothetical protein M405DRAFT_883065 [Rhizopogon salebrosus TDB-379]